jgi:DNA-binding protein HU-beta
MSITTSGELVKVVAGKVGLKQHEVKSVFDAYAEVIAEMSADGDKIVCPGIGNFSIITKAKRVGRNPATGESIEVPARLAYKFKFTGIKNKFKDME